MDIYTVWFGSGIITALILNLIIFYLRYRYKGEPTLQYEDKHLDILIIMAYVCVYTVIIYGGFLSLLAIIMLIAAWIAVKLFCLIKNTMKSR